MGGLALDGDLSEQFEGGEAQATTGSPLAADVR